MNLTQNPTIEELKQLLTRCNDDAAHHVIWVNHQGDVAITPIPEDQTPVGFAKDNEDKIKFRLETCQQGNQYVGQSAANDPEWTQRLFNALTKLWADNWRGYCDGF